MAMEKHRKGLRYILDITPELHRMQPIDELLEALLWQLEGLLGAENSFVATLTSSLPPPETELPASGDPRECFIVIADTPDQVHDLQVRIGTGRFKAGESVSSLPEPISLRVAEALDRGTMYMEEDCSIVPLVLGKRTIGVIYLDQRTGYAKDQELVEIFASQAAAAIQNALLYDMATTDPLTGTYLRGFATQQLEHAIKRSLRRGDSLSLLMIDLDQFKQVNDQFGHQAGDRALAAVGELLRMGCRDTDIVGRYGGDEFMVILPDTPAAGALIVANRLLARAASLTIDDRGQSIPIRLSVGVGTLAPEGDQSDVRVERERLALAAENLIGSADKALYDAKGSGKAGELPTLKWDEVLSQPVPAAS
jgi:diguanylate cyclase (GGDEF)-like protein